MLGTYLGVEMEGSEGGCDVGGGVGEGGDWPTALLKHKSTPSTEDSNNIFAWKASKVVIIISTRRNHCAA